MKRSICNYLNASNETAVKGAKYQRGNFYIMEQNKRRGDRRRYVVMFGDDFIGLGGSLQRLKRFVNQMYKSTPVTNGSEITEEMVRRVRKFGKVAQMELRPRFDDTISSIKETMEAVKKRRKARQPKKAPDKKLAAPRFTDSVWKKYKKDSERARAKSDINVLIRINEELLPHVAKKPQAIPRLIRQNQQVIDNVQSSPRQGRLF